MNGFRLVESKQRHRQGELLGSKDYSDLRSCEACSETTGLERLRGSLSDKGYYYRQDVS
jgi:hypothetical protein